MRALLLFVLLSGCAVRPAGETDLARGPFESRGFEPDLELDWGFVIEPKGDETPTPRPADEEPRATRR